VYDNAEWIQLAKDSVECKTPVNTVMSLPLLGRAGFQFIIQFCVASAVKWKEDISRDAACPHVGHTVYTEPDSKTKMRKTLDCRGRHISERIRFFV